jgi:hypothetical protein
VTTGSAAGQAAGDQPASDQAASGAAGSRAPNSRAQSWRAAWPEIAVAAVFVAATATAGYAVAGVAGAYIVLAGAAVLGLGTVRGLLPGSDPATGDDYLPSVWRATTSFTGYWRKRAGLAEGTKYLTAYDAELRGTLQNLLAARLAERHGVSLHDDPEAARRLLCRTPADERLWYWIDPRRPAASASDQPGIPPRTLARLIDRLERL